MSKLKLITVDGLAEKGIEYSPRHINRLVEQGKFPRPVKQGQGRGGRLAWPENEIDAYIAALISDRDKKERAGRRR